MPQIVFGRIGDMSPPADFLGIVVGDEPNAARVGERIMRSGGNAADAAAAIGLALSVTLPSRVDLEGDGVCLIYDHDSANAEIMHFHSRKDADGGADYLPPRGLAALQARYGVLRWGGVVAPAERLARFGVNVSGRLAADLENFSTQLLSDPVAMATFTTSHRRFLAEGDRLVQEQLAGILARIRKRESQFFQPPGAASVPEWETAIARVGADNIYFVSPVLSAKPNGFFGSIYLTADKDGRVVVCALSAGRPFGNGQDVGSSVLLGMETADIGAAPLFAAIGVDRDINEPVFAGGVAGSDAIERIELASKLEPSVNGWVCARGILTDPRGCKTKTSGESDGYAVIVFREAGLEK